MHVKSSILLATCFALAGGAVFAQTAPGAPGSNQTIPEKEAAPSPPTRSDSEVTSGRSLSQKLDASGGVIKPPSDVDPGISKPAPDPNPNSTPVIKPPGTPGGPPGAEAK
jgi:hypothetical protein